MTDEVVTRLYRALVEELRRRNHPEDRPIKVSALYQTLVPYRNVRSALRVELNADYEHALLRLLAGERDLLRLEPAQAREELRREVDAPYPFVGLFRKFSASNVWVDMSAVGAEAEAAPAEVAPQPAAGVEQEEATAPGAAPQEPNERSERSERIAAEADTVRLRSGGGSDPALARAPMHLHPTVPETPASERMTVGGATCAFCGDDLPSGRRVRFCPHCGGDQRLQPCPRCDAVLEREWRYCISCGQETAGST